MLCQEQLGLTKLFDKVENASLASATKPVAHPEAGAEPAKSVVSSSAGAALKVTSAAANVFKVRSLPSLSVQPSAPRCMELNCTFKLQTTEQRAKDHVRDRKVERKEMEEKVIFLSPLFPPPTSLQVAGSVLAASLEARFCCVCVLHFAMHRFGASTRRNWQHKKLKLLPPTR